MCAAAPGRNIGRRGADIMTGDLVVRAGDVLTPSRIGALAAIGRADVTVYAKPRVAILSTGNEVVEPGRPLEAGQIYDVNRFTLAAIVAAHGGVAAAAQGGAGHARRARGSARRLRRTRISSSSPAAARSASAIWSSDLVAARGEMIFHGIAVKPGKPTAFALVGGRRPLLRHARQPDVVPLERVHPARAVPARDRAPSASRAAHGPRAARPAHRVDRGPASVLHRAAARRRGLSRVQRSGDITSLSQADGYIEIPADQSVVEEGAMVEVTLF